MKKKRETERGANSLNFILEMYALPSSDEV